MSIKITSIAMLQLYFAAVVQRAEHHGHNVSEIVYPLIGFLVATVKDIEVRGHQGSMCNVLWCWLGEERYAFSYNYRVRAIILRRNSLQGPEIGRFTNNSTVADFRKAFAKA